MQPRHTEYDIVTLERGGCEIQLVAVGITNSDRYGDDSLSRLGTTIGEGDGGQTVARREWQLRLGDERGRYEVAGRTTVDEEDSGVFGNGTNEFDETSRWCGELVDL